MHDPPTQVHAYGTHPAQRGDLRLPLGAEGELLPVVVLLHGGTWRARWSSRLMEGLSVWTARESGYAVWNLEYRRIGGGLLFRRGGGGGWPMTFEDVAAGIDHLATLAALGAPLDLERVVLAGWSAGGHLALWAAGRGRLPDGAPGSDPRVRPIGVVAQAPVGHLEDARAAHALMGGTPAEVPERYALASPAALLPLGVPQLVLHTAGDRMIPTSWSRRYAQEAAESGDDADLTLLPEGGHLSHLDPQGASWQAALRWIAARVAEPIPA